MKIAGEYEVKSKATGKVVFIGKSEDIRRDWYFQRLTLLNRTNQNKELMQNFRKYGLSDLEMNILEKPLIKVKPETKEEKKVIKATKPRKQRNKKK